MRVSRDEAASSKFHQEFVTLMMTLRTSGPVFSDTSITSLVTSVIRVALDQMVRQDLRNFQKNMKAAISRALSIPLNVSVGLEAGVVSSWLPPLNCLAVIYSDSLKALSEPERVFEYGIAKFFIGKGVLSMDRSQQVVLAESAVTKKVLDLFLALSEIEEESRMSYLDRCETAEACIKDSILSPIEGSKSKNIKVSIDYIVDVGEEDVIHSARYSF